ncbi:MAG: hypothetical protein JXQ87_16420 [Bacteroidia bacterium]
MKKFLVLLLPFSLIWSCSDDESNPLTIDRGENSEDYFPLAIGSFWQYNVIDSTSNGLENSVRKEIVDSCCYYLNVYIDGSEQSSGWAWRNPSYETMYANGGIKFFTTEYAKEPKGTLYHLDSSSSINFVNKEVASGLYKIRTELGDYECIKTITHISSTSSDFYVTHVRYFGKGIGPVRIVQNFWNNYGTQQASVYKSITYELTAAELKN